MSLHFEDKQRRAGRQTLWLLVAYFLSYATIVYLTYSLMQALTHVATEGVARPRFMALYLLGCPFDASIPGNPRVLVNIALAIALILLCSWLATWCNLRHGGVALARLIGAERIVPKTAGKFDRRLHNIVEEIAIASGTRVPQVFVLRHEKGINSFSAGWRADDAILCVTQGLVDQLSRDEQQAVVAHEFSHILHGDTRLNMRLLGLLVGSHVLIFFSWGAAGSILAGVLYPPFMMYLVLIVEAMQLPTDDFQGYYVAAILVFALAGVSLFNLIMNVFLKLAISRRRIYLADACAVQWTRFPAALISALRKIEQNPFGSRVLHSRAGSVSHMTFASVFRGRSISRFLDTHPTLKSRIRAIESRRELWPEEPKREPRPELTQDPIERAARDWSTDGALREVPLELASTADLLRAIPADIRQLAAETGTVMPLVYALLLDGHDEIRGKQFAMIETLSGVESRDRVREIAAKTDPLAERLRPPLAEITFPTLRGLTAEQYAAFRKTVNALIRADGRIDLFEYTFSALLVRDLDLHFRLIPEARVRYFSCQAVLDPFIVVLSRIAYAGNRGDGMLMRSYQEGIAVFGIRRPILPVKECGMDRLDAALKKLAESSPAVKRRIMRALTACVMADNVVTLKERETLRAVSAMLGLPMPVLA